mmetsp:Transcript_275/g.437  ORF Transcript_275/g.437 Transcript_275/m.437 type:complete len:133 (-) Transcript_275:391-789(-)|eukprot:CAMPEP_0184855002 /NCGR_PEP_ID=MMETSP0580-20130426/354_1 /TAXON_ID=1118495 /ORGANISM="Dactyliosolen fragilissimus" /LENGTH=132 /DNA_ID=CAMNT_0027349407 /DNA_START=32 /DNA_END=430 /DNA_ORIENTATION=+
MAPTVFTGGKLKLKGDTKKSKRKVKKKNRKSKHDLDTVTGADSEDVISLRKTPPSDNNIESNEGTNQYEDDSDNSLTEVERRSRKVKREREKMDLLKVASISHRERVEKFNEDLGKLTELNDIPRVSAAGNG